MAQQHHSCQQTTTQPTPVHAPGPRPQSDGRQPFTARARRRRAGHPGRPAGGTEAIGRSPRRGDGHQAGHLVGGAQPEDGGGSGDQPSSVAEGVPGSRSAVPGRHRDEEPRPIRRVGSDSVRGLGGVDASQAHARIAVARALVSSIASRRIREHCGRGIAVVAGRFARHDPAGRSTILLSCAGRPGCSSGQTGSARTRCSSRCPIRGHRVQPPRRSPTPGCAVPSAVERCGVGRHSPGRKNPTRVSRTSRGRSSNSFVAEVDIPRRCGYGSFRQREKISWTWQTRTARECDYSRSDAKARYSKVGARLAQESPTRWDRVGERGSGRGLFGRTVGQSDALGPGK